MFYIMFDTYFIASRMASAKAPVERFNDAVRSMTRIGFEKETVVRVLKKLLKTYDGNWEHIEADNYNALADVIADVIGGVDDPDPKVCSVFVF